MALAIAFSSKPNMILVYLLSNWRISPNLLTLWLLSNALVNSKLYFPNACCRLSSRTLLEKLLSGECHWTPLIISENLICSVNGWVPSGNEKLYKSMLASLGDNESNCLRKSSHRPPRIYIAVQGEWIFCALGVDWKFAKLMRFVYPA